MKIRIHIFIFSLQAALYQVTICYLIAASSALGTLLSILICLSIVIDQNHRLRLDRTMISKKGFWNQLRALIH